MIYSTDWLARCLLLDITFRLVDIFSYLPYNDDVYLNTWLNWYGCMMYTFSLNDVGLKYSGPFLVKHSAYQISSNVYSKTNNYSKSKK